MALLVGDLLRGVSNTKIDSQWSNGFFSVRTLFTPQIDMVIDAIEVFRLSSAEFGGTVGLASVPFNGNTSVVPWLIGLLGNPVKGDHTLNQWAAANPYMRVQMADTAVLKAGTTYAFVQIGSAAAQGVPISFNSGSINITPTLDSIYSFFNPPTFGTSGSGVGATFNLIESSSALSGFVINGSAPSSYGTQSYGGGASVSRRDPEQQIAFTSAGQSTVTIGMSLVAAKRGDITVVPSAPLPSDISVTTPQGPNSLAGTASGASTASFQSDSTLGLETYPAGIANVVSTTGVTFQTTLTTSAGRGAIDPNRVIVIPENDVIYLYSSRPPYQQNDIRLAPETGPERNNRDGNAMIGSFWIGADMIGGDAQGSALIAGAMFAASSGVATVTMNLGATQGLVANPAGRAIVTSDLGRVTSVGATADGRAGGTWYLAGPEQLAFTSNGRSTAIGYLSSPARMVITSDGRAGGFSYLGTAVPMAATSDGRANAIIRLAAREFLSAVSDGRAGGVYYISSPQRILAQSDGQATVVTYLAGPTPMAFISRGLAGSIVYQSGTFLLPNITMRGVANWTFGPTLLNGISNGVSTVADIRTGGTQHFLATSNGVGRMNDFNSLRLRSNGSAAGTEFDKPPFAFIVLAGCRAFLGSDNLLFGVFAYLSSPVPFRNNDPSISLGSRFNGPSTMEGRSTFTFPYEMVAISNAGCRAFLTGRADGQQPFVPSGVLFTQIGTTYMSAYAQSYSLNNRPQLVFAYMSSPVRFNFSAVGISTFSLGRVDTVVFNGVGGAESNYINVPSYSRQLTQANGVGTFTVFSTGNINGDEILSNGVAGGIFTQQGPVYLQLTSRGKSGPNSLDSEGFNQAWTAQAGCFPYQFVDSNNQTVTRPGVEFDQDRINVRLAMSSSGVATAQIEIDGVPIIRIRSDGVANVSHAGFLVDKFYFGFTIFAGAYGFTSYQVPYPIPSNQNSYFSQFGGRAFGVSIEQFQPRDANFDGVGNMVSQPTRVTPFALTFMNGLGFMSLRDDRVLMEARTNTLVSYAPDIWRMVVNWAFKSRSRGRTRAYATTGPETRPYGDMLAKYFKVAQPGVPDVDGNERPEYGQYWPRETKLPFVPMRTPYPAWEEYEYIQR